MSNVLRLPEYKFHLIASVALSVGAMLYYLSPDIELGHEAKTSALVIATLVLWSSGLISEALTTLIFFSAAVLLRLAPPEIILSGLGSSAFWMIFSGLILGAAIKSSGLSARIAGQLARLLARGRIGTVAGSSLFGLFLAFLMPSAMGRVVLIVPILQDLAARLGLPPASKGSRGIVLAGILGTALPSTAILPSNIPNNVLAGLYENLFQQQLSYSNYLLLHFPVLGAVKAGLLIALLVLCYRESARPASAPSLTEPGPLAPSERRLILYLVVATLLWLTDGVHHISPAWVGLVAAIACLLPGIGILPGKALQSINPEPLFYVSGVVGLGALISYSGLGHHLSEWLQAHIPMSPQGGFRNFMSLCGLSTLVGIFTTLPGVPAVLTPLTAQFAEMSALPQSLVLASQVVGFSTLLFPYQAPPLVAALQLTSISRWEMTRVCLMVAVRSLFVLWPLDYVWLSIVQK